MGLSFDDNDYHSVDAASSSNTKGLPDDLLDDLLDVDFEKTEAVAKDEKKEVNHREKGVGKAKPSLSLDSDFLEKAASSSSYSTESRSALGRIKQIEKGGKTFIVLNEREIPVESLKTNPSETIVWNGNPRLFESCEADIEDLLPLIHQTKGNTIPAFGRWTEIDGKKTIEIIAGSRRRLACIRAGYELLINIIECDDDEALLLTGIENKGREKTSFIADCRWHVSQFEAIQKRKRLHGEEYTQRNYANQQDVSLSTMGDYIAFGRFPRWLTDSISNQASISYRSCNEIRKLLKGDQEALKKKLEGKEYKTANALVKDLKLETATGDQKSTKKSKPHQQDQSSTKIEYVFIDVPIETVCEVVFEVPVEKIVEKEVIREVEVPVEKVVEKEVIREVEVPVEKIVEKEVIREVEILADKQSESSVDRMSILNTEVLAVNGIDQAILIHEKEEGISIEIDDMVNTRLVDAIKQTIRDFTK